MRPAALRWLPRAFQHFVCVIFFLSLGCSMAPAALGSSSAVPSSESEVSRIDLLIQAYKSAPPEEKKALNHAILQEISREVTGQQKLAIQEAIRLKNLRSQERISSRKTKKKARHLRKKYSRKHPCNTWNCKLKELGESFHRFFRRVTQKRRHHIPRPHPKDILRIPEK